MAMVRMGIWCPVMWQTRKWAEICSHVEPETECRQFMMAAAARVGEVTSPITTFPPLPPLAFADDVAVAADRAQQAEAAA